MGSDPQSPEGKSQKVSDSHRNDVSPAVNACATAKPVIGYSSACIGDISEIFVSNMGFRGRVIE